ncbi:hypothetical protein HanXRQr2_Chr03g0101111 [Helianthus annuus]|uniref:Putative kinesin-related domain-containing protein n=1 Tax=Helianthus annuus TaxID=4232 RepID=A0A251V837_HELAN|nr:hypothetical protein HanXRQr2_Chr03g0101111 [Helianthus annuus]KAJ0942876.1 hypothetical protein HanPSC8_Chr03g0097401 [Helianthus annuus]
MNAVRIYRRVLLQFFQPPDLEQMEMELRLEKKCTEELDDALMRSINGHGRMVEHYADLQEEV